VEKTSPLLVNPQKSAKAAKLERGRQEKKWLMCHKSFNSNHLHRAARAMKIRPSGGIVARGDAIRTKPGPALTTNDGFSGLTEGLRAGEHAAAAMLVERFTSRLIALARTRLDPLLVYKVDPEDLVQSVYKSFLKRLQAADCEFDNWDDLWSYLALLTVRKCSDRWHYHRAARRDIAREQPLVTGDGQSTGVLAVMARDPTPPQAAMLAELVERLLAERKPRDREILTLHLQGFTIAEISERGGHAQRTIRRTIALAKHRLREEMEEEDDSRHSEREGERW
jgi:RNA polymerase sigma-70 factor (ECF subfamily)